MSFSPLLTYLLIYKTVSVALNLKLVLVWKNKGAVFIREALEHGLSFLIEIFVIIGTLYV